MRISIAFIVSLLFALQSFAQVKDPVKWTASSRKKPGGYDIVLTATLPKPWHIYSQNTGEGGPVATNFKFGANPLVTFDGQVKEIGALKENYDKLFDTKVKYFGDKVDFVQSVKVKGNLKTNVNVTVEYMTCDDSQCLPPTKKSFNVSL
jgi:hypothetical protein